MTTPGTPRRVSHGASPRGFTQLMDFFSIIDIRDNMTIVCHSKPFHNLLRITREWVITSFTPRFLVALFPVLHYSCHQLAVQVVVRKPGSISHVLIAHIMCKTLQACKQVACWRTGNEARLMSLAVTTTINVHGSYIVSTFMTLLIPYSFRAVRLRCLPVFLDCEVNILC